jgi:RNA polymerase sigma-70 factor (ECF subfamily)
MGSSTALDYEALSERELCARLGAGDSQAARLVVRRHNQRLYRAAWSVLRNRAEAEDAVQEGYLKAFAAIDRFEGDSSLATWLTRIIVNEAISRVRAAKRRDQALREGGLAILQEHRERVAATPSLAAAPEESVMRREFAGLLQRAVEKLPDTFRTVFVLHEVEGLSADEVAESLGIPVETVRTRLFRARRRLRADLGPELRRAFEGAITFAGADCDALTARVVAAFEAAHCAKPPN